MLGIIYTKNTENEQQFYIQSVYLWCIFIFEVLFLIIKGKSLLVFFIITYYFFCIIDFRNFQIQVMKYTLSHMIDRNGERILFHHSGEKSEG